MAFKTETYKIRGMQQDSSESAHSDEFAYENLNVRILTNGNNTSLSVSQDIGNLVESNIYQVNNFGSPTPTISVLTDIIVNSNYTPYMAAQPIAYIPYKVIGYCTIDKYVVLFGIDSLGYSHISRLEYQNGIWYLFEFFDNTVLGFDVDHPIETLANVETEQIKKVYFVDGINELRAINVVNPNSYNNIANLALGFHIGFDETMTVEKNYAIPGRFPSCKIQFAFRYFNQNESESNFVEWSPMFDCDEGDQGFNNELPSQSTETSTNSFKISFTNLLYGDYSNIAIYYFIYPRLSSTSPICYKVNRNINSASYTTNIEFDEGDAIDATYEEVLSSGNTSIIPYTLASKDNFLICGNIKYGLPKLIDIDTKGLFDIVFEHHKIGHEEIDSAFVYQYNPYKTTFNGSNFDYMGYRRGNWYKFGIVCQYITGEWSEVIPLKIKQCNISSKSEVIYDEDNSVKQINYYIPQARLIADSSGTSTIDDRIAFFQTLYNLGFRKILPVCVCPPSDNYRDVLTQGVVTPTMYLPSQRVNCVNEPTKMFAVPSYFFRPQPLKNPIKKINYANEYHPLTYGSSTAITSRERFNDWWYYKKYLNDNASDIALLKDVTPLYPYTIRNVEDIKTNIANVDSVNYNFTSRNKDVITINNNYREFRNGYSLPPKDRINAECEISNVSLNDFCYCLHDDSVHSFFSSSIPLSFYQQFACSNPDFVFGCFYDFEYHQTYNSIGALYSDRRKADGSAQALEDIEYGETIFIDESLCTLNSPEVDYLQSMPSISTVDRYLNSARIEVCGYAQITSGGVNLSTNSDNKSNISINYKAEEYPAEPRDLIGRNIFDIQDSENHSIYMYLINNVKNVRGAKQQVIPFHSGPFWMDSTLTLALFGGKKYDENNDSYERYISHPDLNGGRAFGVTNNDIFNVATNVSSSVDSRYTQLLFKIDARGENTKYKLVPSWTGELMTNYSGRNRKYRKTANLHYTGSVMPYYDGILSGTNETTILYTLDYVFPSNTRYAVTILNAILFGALTMPTDITSNSVVVLLALLDEYPSYGFSADMTQWLQNNLNLPTDTYKDAFNLSWRTACLGLTPASIGEPKFPWKLDAGSNNSDIIIDMSSHGFLATNYFTPSDPLGYTPLLSYYYTEFSSDTAGTNDRLNEDIHYNYSLFYYFWPYTKNMSVTNSTNANNSNCYWYQDDSDNKYRPTTDNMKMMVTYPRNPWNIYWNPYYYEPSLPPGVSGTEYVNGTTSTTPPIPSHPYLAVDPCEYGCHLYSPASMVFPNTLFEPMYLYGTYPLISHGIENNLVYDIVRSEDTETIICNQTKLNETHTLLYSNVTNYFNPVSENDIVETNQEFYSNEQGRYPYIDYGIKTASALRVLYNFGQDGSSTNSSLNLPTVSLIAATKWYRGYLGYDNEKINNESLSCVGNFLTEYNFLGDVAFSGLLPRLYLKSGRIRNMYLDKDNKTNTPISDSPDTSSEYYIDKRIVLQPGNADAFSRLKPLLVEQTQRTINFDHVPTDHIVFTSQYKEGNNRKILPPRFYIDSLINDTEPYTYKNINYQYAYMFPEYYYKAIVDGILPSHPEDVPCRYDAATMYHAFLYPHSVTWCPYPTQALRGNKQNNYEGMPYWEYAQKDDGIEHHGWAARSLNSQMSSYSQSYIMKYDELGNARDEDNYWFLQIANVYNQSLRNSYNYHDVVNHNPYEYDPGVSVAIWDWKACGYSTKISDILNILDGGKETYNVNYCEGDTFFVRYNCPKGYSKRASNSDAENLAENDITDTASLMIESYINLDGQVHKLDNIKNCSEFSNILYPARQEHQLWINDCYSRWDSRIFHENDYNNPQSELDEYPTLIKWSLQKITGESIDSWGVFPASSAYYAHGECGDVNKLLQFNNNVYCFQERGVSILNFNPKSILSTDAGAPVTLAALEEASRLQDLVYVSKDYGTFNKWSVIKTLSSVYFIDNTVKALCRIGSNGIEVLSTSKYMRDYFQNNVDTQTVWTPEFSNDFTHIASFDIKNNNIYFTKKQDVQKKDSIAFDEMLDCFTSFYSYGSTQFMFNYKDSFYALRYNNTILEDAFKTYLYDQRPQDKKRYPKKIFGSKYDSSITLLVNPDFQYDKVFNFIEYYNDKYVSGKSLLSNDSTYSKIKVWNEYQDTGIVDTAGITNQKFRLWRTDIPRASKSRDRIRGQWCKIMLLGCPNDEDPVKYNTDQIHMINVNYTIATQPMKTNVSQ